MRRFTLDTVLDFGLYNGMTLRELINDEPELGKQYVLWMMRTFDDEFCPTLMEAVEGQTPVTYRQALMEYKHRRTARF